MRSSNNSNTVVVRVHIILIGWYASSFYEIVISHLIIFPLMSLEQHCGGGWPPRGADGAELPGSHLHTTAQPRGGG